MKKKKILFRELLVEVYTDGSVKVDGLSEFYNKKQRTEIMRMLREIYPSVINAHLK